MSVWLLMRRPKAAMCRLESAAEQLEAMNRMPLDFHLRNLVASVDYGDKIEDAMETTTALYLAGEIGMIMPALRKNRA